MSQFYGSIKGNRGEATRCGSKASGIVGHIRGWDQGVKVIGHVDENGAEVFEVIVSGGSNGGSSDQNIGHVINGAFYPGEKSDDKS